MGKKIVCALVAVIVFSPIAAHSDDFNGQLSKQYSVAVKTTDVDAVKMQKRYDWDSGGLLIYKGVAAPKELSSSGTWMVFKYSYNDSDSTSNPDLVEAAEGAWTSRTSLTYHGTKW